MCVTMTTVELAPAQTQYMPPCDTSFPPQRVSVTLNAGDALAPSWGGPDSLGQTFVEQTHKPQLSFVSFAQLYRNSASPQLILKILKSS